MSGKLISWTFNQEGGRQPYKVYLSVPDDAPPKDGFPVMYILDGNAFFTMFREMIKLQSRRSEKTGIEPMVLVGIGYEGDKPFHQRRVYDFTPPSESLQLPERPDGTPWPDTGGADHFLHFLEHQVKPFVEGNYCIDKQRQTLFGHSLGGLFVLYALFHKPEAFTRYFACSPSIWWNERAILKDEGKLEIVEEKRLFIAAERGEKAYMYEDALALHTRLRDYALLQTAFFSPEGENHMSIVPAVLSRGLRFLGEEKVAVDIKGITANL